MQPGRREYRLAAIGAVLFWGGIALTCVLLLVGCQTAPPGGGDLESIKRKSTAERYLDCLGQDPHRRHAGRAEMIPPWHEQCRARVYGR